MHWTPPALQAAWPCTDCTTPLTSPVATISSLTPCTMQCTALPCTDCTAPLTPHTDHCTALLCLAIILQAAASLGLDNITTRKLHGLGTSLYFSEISHYPKLASVRLMCSKQSPPFKPRLPSTFLTPVFSVDSYLNPSPVASKALHSAQVRPLICPLPLQPGPGHLLTSSLQPLSSKSLSTAPVDCLLAFSLPSLSQNWPCYYQTLTMQDITSLKSPSGAVDALGTAKQPHS